MRAFDDGGLATWIEPHDVVARRRATGLAALAQFEVVFVPRRRIDVRGEPALAVAVWAEPGTWALTEGEESALGPRMAEALGTALARCEAVLAAIDARHPVAPHWTLDLLAVDPHAHGQGIGTRLLADGLHRADEGGTPTYLWTALPGNVGFYGRHGFEMLWHEPALGGDGPPAWGLWREPGAGPDLRFWKVQVH